MATELKEAANLQPSAILVGFKSSFVNSSKFKSYFGFSVIYVSPALQGKWRK
jgi:hypothetical protein